MYIVEPAAQVPPAEASYPEVQRIRSAAFRAKRVLPEQVGLLVWRELNATADFGYAPHATSPVARLVDEVLALPDPGDAT